MTTLDLHRKFNSKTHVLKRFAPAKTKQNMRKPDMASLPAPWRGSCCLPCTRSLSAALVPASQSSKTPFVPLVSLLTEEMPPVHSRTQFARLEDDAVFLCLNRAKASPPAWCLEGSASQDAVSCLATSVCACSAAQKAQPPPREGSWALP